MPWFIKEENTRLNEIAYYGPFDSCELSVRLNDPFADLMASGLANLDAIWLSQKEADQFYINPREFWMSQLATLGYIQETLNA